LRDELGLAALVVSHDLGLAWNIADLVAVMYLGRIVEEASREELFKNPRHPYTQSLLSAVPLPDPVLQRGRRRVLLEGDIPSPVKPPSGCRFHTRCPVAELPMCADADPQLVDHRRDRHVTACHLVRGDGQAPDVTRGADPVVHHKA
jgi:oligopeptide/dipeptide ABC transporter ATP-binding protein